MADYHGFIIRINRSDVNSRIISFSVKNNR